MSTSGFNGGVMLYDEGADQPWDVLRCLQFGSQNLTLEGGHTYYFIGVSFLPQTINLGITLLDTVPSMVVPDDITVEATSPEGAAIEFTATASDQEDGELPVDCSMPSGATFALGDTTVQCTVTDSFGVSTLETFVVHVVDTTVPVLALPGPGPSTGRRRTVPS